MKFFINSLTLLLCICAGIAFASPAARLYDAGLRALSHGEQEKAKIALENAVARDASLADAHCVLGLIYRGAAEFHAAAEAFRCATIADADYIEAYCELGDVLLIQLGQTDGAIHALQKAVALDEAHARARTLLGIAYFRENETDAALRELQRAVQLNPTSHTAHYTLGLVHLQKEAWASAIAVFKQLLELDPGHAKAHFSLGTAYRRIGKIAAAQAALHRFETLSVEAEQLTHLKRFARQEPANAQVWYQLGRLHLKRQQWHEAAQALERYVTLAPEETRGYEALGFLHFQRQNYPQAMAMYQNVIQRKPNVATYRNGLAGVYVMLERYPEAIQQYQNAIRLKPSEPRFYLNLSKAYRLAGDVAEAEKAQAEYERLTSKSQ